MAVIAGHDMILQDYASDPEITLNAVIAAVKSGEIDITQIDESVKHILEFKEKLGLLDRKPVDIESVSKLVHSQEHEAVSKEMCDKAVTVLEAESLPFKLSKNEKILLVATKGEEEGIGAEDLHGLIDSKSSFLFNQCKKLCESTVLHVLNENPKPEEVDKLMDMAVGFDTIIFGSFIREISYKEGSGSIPEAQVQLINKLNALSKRLVVILFGNPYAVGKLNNLKNCILAFGDCEFLLESAVKVLFGEIGSRGRLPVTINAKYKYGYGINTKTVASC